MKKLLLILLFVGSFTFSKAQSAVYHPLPSDSLVWLESHQDWEGIYHYSIVEVKGDTVIGSYTYKKVYTAGEWSSPFYSTSTPVYYNEAIRQDIPGKKVYQLSLSGVETVLYDFNKVAGDILTIVTVTGGMQNDTIRVTSVDSVLVGTQYHKRFNVSSTYFWYTNGYQASALIEGVGNEAGFGHYYQFEFENAYNLMCFSYNNVQQYPSSGVMPGGPYCYLTVGLVEIEKDNFKIQVMPNPTADMIRLNVGCKENYNVEITNSTGQQFLQKSNQTAAELSFDLGNYPAGVYFIRLSDSKGNSVVKKIIKE